MLNACIFNEYKSEVVQQVDEEMEDESEEVIPTSSRSRARAAKRERPVESSEAPVEDPNKSKKMKIDHEEQVAQLIKSS
jgi:hypothetical protein